MVTLLFPGQGSQEVGMGGSLFERFTLLTRQTDDILGYSIAELCNSDPRRQLGLTQFTQPALFVVCALSYLAYRATAEVPPAYVVGHSVGEYAALFAAEAFDFATGLKLVKKRGELMAGEPSGGMAAVIGLDEEHVRKVLDEHHLSTLAIANYNAPTQLVLAGPSADLCATQELFIAAGARMYKLLDVSGAFHSRYMLPAQEKFREYIRQFQFYEPRIPVISTVDALPHTHETVACKLVDQLTQPVQWVNSVQYLAQQGEETYIEIGPGQVLTKLVRRIQREMGLLLF